MSLTCFSAALAAITALPMGDDTPITLYVIVGIVAVVLIIASVILGKLSKK